MNIILILAYPTYYLLGKWPNLKGRDLTVELYDRIKENGISHYTTENNSEKILKERVLKSSDELKSYSNDMKKCTFFLCNESKLDTDQIDLCVSNKKSTCISISNLTREQLINCKYRTFDNAIIYQGDFEVHRQNIVSVTKAKPHNRKIFQPKEFLFVVQFFFPIISIFIIFFGLLRSGVI